MSDKNPTVSIIVPNYNYGRFLDQRITSILNQTYTDYELILLDDASTDESITILEKYRKNPHVTQIEVNKQNTGSPFRQWMKGILLAKGEWVWIAEADDLCEPTFLETCMHYIGQQEKAAICNVGSVYIDEKGNTINQNVHYWSKEEAQTDAICFDGQKFVEYILYWQNEIPNASGVIFRKEYALHLKNQEWTKFRYCGDWLFWTGVAMQGKVIQIHQTLNYFRQHVSQTTQGRYNGQSYIETFKISLYIESQLPSINSTKRRLRHGKDVRIIRHHKNKQIKQCVMKEYHKLFHSSKLKDYLYFKLHKKLKFLPYTLTEEKDRIKALSLYATKIGKSK